MCLICGFIYNEAEGWPDDDRSTRIVIIAQDLDHQEIASCFRGFGLKTEATGDLG